MFIFGTANDVVTMAVRIEENGKAFYEGVAAKTEEPAIKKLFEELAAMEDGHIQEFKNLRAGLEKSFTTERVWDPEGLAESLLQASADTHIFTVKAATERLKAVNTAEEALDMALRFEKDSVVFFLGMKDVLPDESGKGEIDKLIEAERDHVRMLSAKMKELAETGSTTI